MTEDKNSDSDKAAGLDRWLTPTDSAKAVYNLLSTQVAQAAADANPIFSPKQLALLSDTQGLLMAIGNGRTTVGQERIRTNLVEVIAMFEAPEFTQPKQTATIRALCDVLQQASTAGLTIEGNTFPNARTKAEFSR